MCWLYVSFCFCVFLPFYQPKKLYRLDIELSLSYASDEYNGVFFCLTIIVIHIALDVYGKTDEQICTVSVLLLWWGSLLCGKWFYCYSFKTDMNSVLGKMLTCWHQKRKKNPTNRFKELNICSKCHIHSTKSHCWAPKSSYQSNLCSDLTVFASGITMGYMHMHTYTHTPTHPDTHMHNQAFPLPLPLSTPSAYVSIWLPPQRDCWTDWSRFDFALEVLTQDGGQKGKENAGKKEIGKEIGKKKVGGWISLQTAVSLNSLLLLTDLMLLSGLLLSDCCFLLRTHSSTTHSACAIHTPILSHLFQH